MWCLLSLELTSKVEEQALLGGMASSMWWKILLGQKASPHAGVFLSVGVFGASGWIAARRTLTSVVFGVLEDTIWSVDKSAVPFSAIFWGLSTWSLWTSSFGRMTFYLQGIHSPSSWLGKMGMVWLWAALGATAAQFCTPHLELAVAGGDLYCLRGWQCWAGRGNLHPCSSLTTQPVPSLHLQGEVL